LTKAWPHDEESGPVNRELVVWGQDRREAPAAFGAAQTVQTRRGEA